jgi:NTP pyrophosphatase (non-canonical NTP hydrolase)
MNLHEFIPLATRTESTIEKVSFDKSSLVRLLQIYIAVGTMLDMVKKNVFYGKPISSETWSECSSTIELISQQLNKRGNTPLLLQPEINVDPRLFHGILGIATESTELVEILQQAIEGKPLNRVHLGEEMFDLNWYQAILCDANNLDWERLLDRGIEKLRVRFPDKFDANRAINRNLESERKALEGEV